MKYYIEIKIVDDNHYINILNTMYTQLHLAIVESKSNIGISFKDYYCDSEDDRISGLGDSIVLFANTIEELEKLNLSEKLSVLINKNEIVYTEIKEVPSDITEYAIFSKVHTKNVEGATKRRWERRNPGKTFVINEKNKSNLPFVRFKSLSNGNMFNIYIERKIVDKEVKGKFGSYGLSSTVTVPIF